MMVFIGLAILLDPVNLFLGCDNRLVKGVNVPYTPGFEGEITLDDTCNQGCSCDVDYEPICANHFEIYFSPCHAGCKTSYKDMENKTVSCYHFCCCSKLLLFVFSPLTLKLVKLRPYVVP